MERQESGSSSEFTGELIGQATGWQSIPGAVRFAVWLWAISTIIGCVVGVVVGFAFLVSL